MEAWKPGSLEAWKPGSLEAWKPGSLEAWKPGSPEAWKPGSLEAWKPVFSSPPRSGFLQAELLELQQPSKPRAELKKFKEKQRNVIIAPNARNHMWLLALGAMITFRCFLLEMLFGCLCSRSCL